MHARALEISWHEGLAIWAVDASVCGRLVTAGGDKVARVWRLRQNAAVAQAPLKSSSLASAAGGNTGGAVTATAATPRAVDWLCDLRSHTSTINAARFSKDGKTIATAADTGEIVLWQRDISTSSTQISQPTPFEIAAMNGSIPSEERWVRICTLRGHVQDVLDLSWGPDGSMLASASVDNAIMIWNVKKNTCAATLRHHANFVQGVAVDPLGRIVASLGNDRCLRAFVRELNNNHRGHANSENWRLIAVASNAPDDTRLFADDSRFKNFFRRLSWSPDGSILACPSGLHTPQASKKLFAVHLFSRINLSVPVVQCGNLTRPASAVKFCPVIFKLRRLRRNNVQSEKYSDGESQRSSRIQQPQNIQASKQSKALASSPEMSSYSKESQERSGELEAAVTAPSSTDLPNFCQPLNNGQSQSPARMDGHALAIAQSPVPGNSASTPLTVSSSPEVSKNFTLDAQKAVAMDISPPISLVAPSASLEQPQNIAKNPPPQLLNEKQSPARLPFHDSFAALPYRMVFAVACTDTVFIYDTETCHRPIGRVTGLHLAELTDLSWNADGSMLLVSSTDGYVSIISFENGELGTPLLKEEFPYWLSKQERKELCPPPLKPSQNDTIKEVVPQRTPRAPTQPPANEQPRPVSDKEDLTSIAKPAAKIAGAVLQPPSGLPHTSAVSMSRNLNGQSSRIMASSKVPIDDSFRRLLQKSKATLPKDLQQRLENVKSQITTAAPNGTAKKMGGTAGNRLLQTPISNSQHSVSQKSNLNATQHIDSYQADNFLHPDMSEAPNPHSGSLLPVSVTPVAQSTPGPESPRIKDSEDRMEAASEVSDKFSSSPAPRQRGALFAEAVAGKDSTLSHVHNPEAVAGGNDSAKPKSVVIGTAANPLQKETSADSLNIVKTLKRRDPDSAASAHKTSPHRGRPSEEAARVASQQASGAAPPPSQHRETSYSPKSGLQLNSRSSPSQSSPNSSSNMSPSSGQLRKKDVKDEKEQKARRQSVLTITRNLQPCPKRPKTEGTPMTQSLRVVSLDADRPNLQYNDTPSAHAVMGLNLQESVADVKAGTSALDPGPGQGSSNLPHANSKIPKSDDC